jgi:hypothetical protein
MPVGLAWQLVGVEEDLWGLHDTCGSRASPEGFHISHTSLASPCNLDVVPQASCSPQKSCCGPTIEMHVPKACPSPTCVKQAPQMLLFRYGRSSRYIKKVVSGLQIWYRVTNT